MLQEGQIFGEFEILTHLGGEGERATYHARQSSVGRMVVLKALRVSPDGGAEKIARFRRDAAAALALDHPDIVRALAIGETDGVHWIALEWIEGTDAFARLKRKGKLALAEALAIATHVATALDNGWRTARLIHGDIEPRRILLSKKSEVKLAGLGFGHAPGEMRPFVAEGSATSATHYLSPECAEGKKDADFRADIYSLGCTLFHLIGGEPPYHGETALAVVLQHVTKPVPELRAARPDCPSAVSRVVMKMMHKLPAGRHQSYEELIADLRLCHEAITSAAALPPAPPASRISEPRRESPGANAKIPASVATPEAPLREQPKPLAVAAPIPDPMENPPDKNQRRPTRKPLVIAGAVLLAGIAALVYFTPWKKNGGQLSEAERADQERAARKAAGIPDPVPSPKPALAKATPVRPKPAVTPTPIASATATEKPAPTAEPKPDPAPIPAPAPTPAPTVAQSATAKWLAEQVPQWEAAFAGEVTAPFEKGVADLNAEYLKTVERELATLPPNADRISGQAFRAERARISGGGSVPAEDESMAPPSLRTLRAGYRTTFARLDSERASRARAAHARTDAILTKAQAGLTQQQRFAEAVEIQATRNSLRESWLKLPAGTASAVGEMPPPPASPTPPKPAATPAPKLPRLTPRELVEHLLAMDAAVSIGNGGPPRAITKIEDLPSGKFSILKIEFIPHEGLTAADLEIIEQLTDAEELKLTGVPATDATLRPLHSLTALRVLWLRDMKAVTAAGIRPLATLPSLTTLNLRGSVGAESLTAFATNRRLDSLTLNDLTFSEKDFAAVAAIPALKTLNITTRDPLVPAAWSRLASAKKLTALNVEKTPKSAEMIAHISRCAALTSLSLGDVTLRDADLAPLTALKTLQSLKTTAGSSVDGSIFAAWPANTKLKTLAFPSTASVTDKALRGIEAAFPLLTQLELRADAANVTPAGLAHLQKLKHLTKLSLHGDAVDPAGLAHLSTLPEITHLDIGSPRLTDADVRTLVKFTGLRELEWLNPPVTDLALKSYARLRALTQFKVGAKMKKEDTDKLEVALPAVKIVP